MELVYLLAYGMLVKRNGGIRFLVTFWDRVGGCFHQKRRLLSVSQRLDSFVRRN